jgi:D-alanyl-D-alanine carboxypeptidase
VAFDGALSRALAGDRAASVAVLSPGSSSVHAAAWGVRDPATGQTVDTGDRFRIASISKILTAVVVLQLVEEGRVGLDEPIGDRLAWAAGAAAADADMSTVTPRMLLSHTSGIPKYRSVYFGAGGAASCPEAARIAMAGAVDVDRPYAYSNTNFCLLGLLVEQLTGQPYEDVVRQRLLSPLGINGMRMAGTFDVRDDEVVHPSGAGRTYMEALGGAGAWLATPSDLVAIMRSLDPALPSWHPLGPDLLREMRTPQSVAPGEEAQYGLGLMIWPDGAVGHTGTIEQTRAMVLEEPGGAVWAVTVSGESPWSSSKLRDPVDAALAG